MYVRIQRRWKNRAGSDKKWNQKCDGLTKKLIPLHLPSSSARDGRLEGGGFVGASGVWMPPTGCCEHTSTARHKAMLHGSIIVEHGMCR